jgi:hypothetical protein
MGIERPAEHMAMRIARAGGTKVGLRGLACGAAIVFIASLKRCMFDARRAVPALLASFAGPWSQEKFEPSLPVTEYSAPGALRPLNSASDWPRIAA